MGIKLFLEPLDTLFCRDNKPFSAGEDTFAESKFPSSLTIFGAIGNYILERNNTNLKFFLQRTQQDPDLGEYNPDLNSTTIKLKGPFIFRNRLYLPPPANLFLIDRYEYKILFPDSNASPKWDIEDSSLKPVRLVENRECEPVKHYIPADEIERYLKKEEIISITTVKESHFFIPERKFGHKLSRDTLTVEEGFLYSTEQLRFTDFLNSKVYEKTEILIIVEGIDSSKFSNDIIFLGGERKRARIRWEDNDISFKNNEVLTSIKSNKKFFLYFITPVIFKNGFNRASWPMEFNDAELVGAVIGKPLFLSGWQRTDVAQGFPRPLKRAVPPGSVYFFKVNNWDDARFDTLYDKYNFNESLSEEYSCTGFGIVLIGAW